MFASVGKAVGMIFDPALFGVVLKSLALTLILFIVLFLGLQWGLHHVPPLHWPWLNTAIDWIASLALVVLLFIVGAPVAALFGTFFLGGVAKSVERKYYPADAPSPGAPFFSSLFVALRFTGLVIVATFALLPFDVILPGVGSAATLVMDGWLLGREYFELVALRHLSRGEADDMRKRHRFAILGGGVLLALLTYIPFADLIAPLFGAALMTHLFKFYQHQE
ncbi:MAG TPA: EI24 domain-containing protein [Rhizomicrobium sp.]|nr:EI24 domain-containing protein [Rhizomicrobium sp.]